MFASLFSRNVVSDYFDRFTFLDQYQDPRIKDYPFLTSYIPTLIITIAYFAFVKYFGPKFMEHRKPYNLKNVILFYNMVQMYLNFKIFQELTPIMFTMSPICNKIVTNYEYPNNVFMRTCVVYFGLKVLDLLDTVFLVLKKKHNHISFLHLHHHSSMIPGTWTAVRFWPGSHTMFIVYFNVLVHVIMYGYYSLAILYPNSKMLAKLKQYITTIQIAQLTTFIVLMFLTLMDFSCEFNKGWTSFYIFNTSIMWINFVMFYYRAYIKTKVN